jgi:hypothetical protein
MYSNIHGTIYRPGIKLLKFPAFLGIKPCIFFSVIYYKHVNALIPEVQRFAYCFLLKPSGLLFSKCLIGIVFIGIDILKTIEAKMLLGNLNRALNRINLIVRMNRNFFSTSTSSFAKSSQTDEPVKYSTSKWAISNALFSLGLAILGSLVKFQGKAKDWNPHDTFVINQSKLDRPKSQIYLIVSSVAVFLLYFLVIREPNDIDEILSSPLENKHPTINKVFVDQTIKKYEAIGLDVSKLKESLKNGNKNQ